MLMSGIAPTLQITLRTPDFFLPVARMSWKSFRQLPDAAATYNSFVHSDHQVSYSLRKPCRISQRTHLFSS